MKSTVPGVVVMLVSLVVMAQADTLSIPGDITFCGLTKDVQRFKQRAVTVEGSGLAYGSGCPSSKGEILRKY